MYFVLTIPLLSSFWCIKLTASTTLLQDCVLTALREKTVILVTHQVEFLSEVDTILVNYFILMLIILHLNIV